MKVLIVSDTHGRHAGIEEAIQREFPFQRLIHLGDAEGYEDYIADLAECPIGYWFPETMTSFLICRWKKSYLSMISAH